MKSLGKQCPGPEHQCHKSHQSVAGHWPGIGSISKHAAKYAPAFVKAVLRVTRPLPPSDCLQVLNESASECLAAHAVDELNQQDDADKMKTI